MQIPELRLFDAIPIDERHTLHQLLGRFQAVRDGLPELVKNAKDQYARLGVPDADQRHIVVIANTELRRLAVLDFAGAAREDFEHWLVWSSPDASRVDVAAEIEGRHGNGGKGFMVRGSTEQSSLESVRDGLRTRVGFRNDRPDVRYHPGYFVEDGVEVRELPVGDVGACLDRALDGLGVTRDALPADAVAAFEGRGAFTLARVDGVRAWRDLSPAGVRMRAAELATELVSHAQVALTVDTCAVWVVIDGRTAAGPLKRALPDPLEGFERPRTARVPETLVDPETGDRVSTGDEALGPRSLTLRTSARSLRMPGKRPLNVIRVRDDRNIIASWTVADLHLQAQSAYMFGELRVPALAGDHLAGADRTALADTPLVRALRAWVAERIASLCEDVQRAMAEDYGATDRRRVNGELRRFRRLMGGFLDELRAGRSIPQAADPDTLPRAEALEDDLDELEDDELEVMEAEGDEADADVDAAEVPLDEAAPLPDASPLAAAREAVHIPSPPSGRRRRPEVVSLRLEPDRERLTLAVGTRVPLIARVTVETPAGVRRAAQGVPLIAHIEPIEAGASADDAAQTIAYRPDGAVVEALTPGRARLRLEERRSGLVTEPVEIEVVACSGLRLTGDPGRPLRQGEQLEVTATFATEDGPRDDLVVEAWLDQPAMGRVDRRARLTAGRHAGEVSLFVRYGAGDGEVATMDLVVGDEIELERAGRRLEGSGVPYILICGTPAPGMGAFPLAQRTVQGGAHEPTIIDFEPQFEHVIWINPSSEESVRVREGRGGRRGVAGIGTKPYLRFLALKCFEILKRLYVRQRVADRRISEAEFRRLFAQAEMACAPFIDDAYQVAESLAGS